MVDERLHQRFWLSEFLRSESAVRKGIDNIPSASALVNIRNILAPGMHRVRSVLRVPVLITSGFRSPALNAAVGGSTSSQHIERLAADFIAAEFGTPKKFAQHLVNHAPELHFDQLIWEGQWVHISFSPRKARSEALTAHFFQGGGHLITRACCSRTRCSRARHEPVVVVITESQP